MKQFECPHNQGVTIQGACPVKACPFHVGRVSEFFAIEAQETCCVFYDTPLMNNVPNSRTQISALSRNSAARVSSKEIRRLYETSLGYMKTLYALTNSVPNRKPHCSCCGYPNKIGDCTTKSLCRERRSWTDYVISLYALDTTHMKRELIWDLLFQGDIHCEPNALTLGHSLLSTHDAQHLLKTVKKTED